jgi:hypothetical protein
VTGRRAISAKDVVRRGRSLYRPLDRVSDPMWRFRCCIGNRLRSCPTRAAWAWSRSTSMVDPAAGSFIVMHVTNYMGRNFVGCDIACEPLHRDLNPSLRLPCRRQAETFDIEQHGCRAEAIANSISRNGNGAPSSVISTVVARRRGLRMPNK